MITAGGNNGVEHITEIDDASGSIQYTYNVLGQVTQEKKITSGVAYTIGYAYDLDGEVTRITYPSGRSVNYSRDSTGPTRAVAPPTTTSTTSGTGWPSNGLVLSKIFTEDYLAELRVLVWDRLLDCLGCLPLGVPVWQVCLMISTSCTIVWRMSRSLISEKSCRSFSASGSDSRSNGDCAKLSRFEEGLAVSKNSPTGTFNTFAICVKRLAPTRVWPRSYFCTC